MFRPMRRKSKEISLKAAQQLLMESRRGVLAINGDDGYPYAIPVNYAYDAEKGTIFFHGAKAGHKIDALKACDKVCFTVYGNESIREEAWAPYMQSVVIFGRCRLVADQQETEALARRLAMKYYPNTELVDEEIARSGKAIQMYEIHIEHMTGKEIQEK